MLCYVMFCDALQSLKDAMIVTSCGAEALPLISAFGVLPASVAFILYYDKLVWRANLALAASTVY